MKSGSAFPCDCIICQEQREEGRRREAFGGETETGGEKSVQTTLGFDAGRIWNTGSARIERFENVEALIDRLENPSFQDEADAIFEECRELLIARQKRYGSSNIEQQGPWGVLSRIANDKLERIKRAFNGTVVNGNIVLDEFAADDADESLEDAIKDLVNYGVILLMLKRGVWGRPLADEAID